MHSLDDLPKYDELMAQIKVLNENVSDSIYNEFDIDENAEEKLEKDEKAQETEVPESKNTDNA